MAIRLRSPCQVEWRCPSQIQNWLLCFPGPLSASGCTGGLPSGRMATPPRGTPVDLETLRGRTGRPVCLPETSLRKYAFPPVSLLAQTLCKVREYEEQVLLVAPYWPNRTWFPKLMLLATAPPWQIPLRRDLLSQRGGILWHPRPDLWNLHVWSLDGTRRF